MRENIGHRTATTFVLVDQHPHTSFLDEAIKAPLRSPYVWESEQDARNAFPRPTADASGFEHTEYYVPGLEVHAFYVDGTMLIITVFEDIDLTRVHTALRTGREITIRYVKESGEVSRRRVRPQSMFTSKAGNVVLRADDDRREGDTRNFRWDRITHTTLHRRVRRSAPSKGALVREFTAAVPAPQALYSTSPDTSAAVQASEDVQGLLADAFASGLTHVRVPV